MAKEGKEIERNVQGKPVVGATRHANREGYNWQLAYVHVGLSSTSMTGESEKEGRGKRKAAEGTGRNKSEREATRMKKGQRRKRGVKRLT